MKSVEALFLFVTCSKTQVFLDAHQHDSWSPALPRHHLVSSCRALPLLWTSSAFFLFFFFFVVVLLFSCSSAFLFFSLLCPPFLWFLLLGWRGWGWGWNREKIILEEVTFAALWLTTCVSGSLYLHVSHGKEGSGEGVTERGKTGIWFLFVELNSELQCLFPAMGRGKYKFDSSPPGGTRTSPWNKIAIWIHSICDTHSFVCDVCRCTEHVCKCECCSSFDVPSLPPRPWRAHSRLWLTLTPVLLKHLRLSKRKKKVLKDFPFHSPFLFGRGPSVQTVSAGTLSRWTPWAPQLLAPVSPL